MITFLSLTFFLRKSILCFQSHMGCALNKCAVFTCQQVWFISERRHGTDVKFCARSIPHCISHGVVVMEGLLRDGHAGDEERRERATILWVQQPRQTLTPNHSVTALHFLPQQPRGQPHHSRDTGESYRIASESKISLGTLSPENQNKFHCVP